MKDSGLLPAGQSRLLELGQRSGAGDAAMEKIARDLSEESEAALENAVSRVEPALVLICSLLVGLILLSVMLPLMHIMSAIG
jgi:type IV pilus assembly protein PilC